MKIHFIGICGVSMSMLARLARSRGHTISGSDLKLGGHSKDNVCDVEEVVYTSAVGCDNVELIQARKMGIPLRTRAEFLGTLMKDYATSIAVSGSHGKTSVTGMLWRIFESCNPTVHIGGSVEGKGGNVGSADYFITEACEYQRNFLELKPNLGIILNVDLDHTDCYDSLAQVEEAFRSFALGSRKVLTSPDIAARLGISAVTVGESHADYIISDIHVKDGKYDFRLNGCLVKLNVIGRHNVTNAAIAIAAAVECGMDICQAADRLAEFRGVDRRMEYVGDFLGKRVVSDYAHHPSEIECTLKALRECGFGRMLVLFEPHTYSRTKAFLTEFVNVLSTAECTIMLPIFAAREKDDGSVSSFDIVKQIQSRGAHCLYAANYDDAEKEIEKRIDEFDIIVVLGAGTIDELARRLAMHYT